MRLVTPAGTLLVDDDTGHVRVEGGPLLAPAVNAEFDRRHHVHAQPPFLVLDIVEEMFPGAVVVLDPPEPWAPLPPGAVA